MGRFAKGRNGDVRLQASRRVRRSAVEPLERRDLLAALVANWNMNTAPAPYADQSGNASLLALDPNTAAPHTTAGVHDGAAQLAWASVPGVSTRLSTSGNAVQTDSFGFSFWVRPTNLSPYENLIGKEMLATSVGPDFSRMAWQVHLGGDNGSGSAPLEFLVRGSDRSQGDFYGSVFSSALLPLHADAASWYHIAGGYDWATGQITLLVNSQATFSAGRAGARNSDGGAFVVGTMVNGASFVSYAALAVIDEVQLYDGPLSIGEAASLYANPGRTAEVVVLPSPPATLVANWKFNEAGPEYHDASGHLGSLLVDNATSGPLPVSGVELDGLQLGWQANPGVTTRLYASSSSLQTDNFGFSFWIKPTRLAPFENFIAKEVGPLTGPNYERVAWQVQVGQDNGDGLAPVQLVVRGTDRSQGNYFGSVYSASLLPLNTDMNQWLHVAGGYDTVSGVLSLYLNGVAALSKGLPGARNSDGSMFDVGSVRNAGALVAFGAIAAIDDVQLFDQPLSTYDVASIIAFPGRQVLTHLAITNLTFSPNGDVTLSFNSHDA